VESRKRDVVTAKEGLGKCLNTLLIPSRNNREQFKLNGVNCSHSTRKRGEAERTVKVTLNLTVHTMNWTLYDSSNSSTLDIETLSDIEFYAREMLAIFAPIFPGYRLTVTAKTYLEVTNCP